MKPVQRPNTAQLALSREDFELMLEAIDELDEALEDEPFLDAEELRQRGALARLALQISNVYLRAFVNQGSEVAA